MVLTGGCVVILKWTSAYSISPARTFLNRISTSCLLDSAKFGDEHEFQRALASGKALPRIPAAYVPNPSLLASAVATITKRTSVSTQVAWCCLMHDTIRVAEEWSIVDNLSKDAWPLPSLPAGMQTISCSKPDAFFESPLK